MYLKMIRKARKMTLEELANKIGTTKSNLSLVENGKIKINIDKAERIAEALNCKPTDLTGSTTFNAEIKSRMIPIKYFDIKASAGSGLLVDNETFEMISIDEEQLKRMSITADYNNIVIINAKGNSMSPTIQDNDLLFVDIEKKEIFNKKIYVINEDNLLKVKRLIKKSPNDTEVIVQSDNEVDGEYPPYPIKIDGSHNIICGQVIFYCRSIK
jgi:phage repressor protein C with HTH and peptisase S24 domain